MGLHWIRSMHRSRNRYLHIGLMLGLAIFMISIIGIHAAGSSITLVVINAKVWTGNSAPEWAEALAISGETIVAVGSDDEIGKLIDKSTHVIDAKGQMAVPGFIDSHIHFLSGGFQLSSVQLRDARTPEDFINRIRIFAETVEPGTWITGGDWDHEQWGGKLPQRTWIDSVTSDHPVWVNRLDGHMALANSLALKMAGITKSTPDISGGTVVRTPDGELTGILKDNAMSLIYRVIPEPTDYMKDRALEAAMHYVAEQGVTSIHHMGNWDDLAVFERANAANKMITRIYAAVPLSSWKQLAEKLANDGHGDQWLRIGGLKGFVDGSLGSHTAAFFEPFTDAPNDSGLLVNSSDDLYHWIAGADRAGLPVMVHAIGDRAISLLLDIYARVIQENGPRDRRFRIEHSQHIAPRDIPRFHELDVIASMQPYHAIDDGRWAEKVIGPERIKTTYAFRSLLDINARIAFGSDWSVAPPTPLEGIYAAVTRRTLDNKNPDGWVPEQKIRVEDALRCYTMNAAYASFEEDIKGSLKPGKLADLVIIDRDITDIPVEEIRDARITMTIVGGKVVFARQEKAE